MTIYHGTVFDTPGDFGDPEGLRADEDCALVVQDGTIRARTDLPAARAEFPDDDVVELGDGILIPGLVDTHVHYPQVRVIGGLGMPLLDWLNDCALPEEARLADTSYAGGVAEDFLASLIRSGTTSALVFGSHFPQAVDVLFAAAAESGLRITTGMVMSDRGLPEELLLGPDAALAAGRELADRWHGQGRLRYAVTPRFSLSTTSEMLQACHDLLGCGAASSGDVSGDGEGLWVTSHLNEDPAEIAEVARLFPRAGSYTETYAQHGLVNERSVFAHNVHASPSELELLADGRAAVAHCPSSNFALGSGLFPLREHIDAGVRVGLGSDVGAGTGFCLMKEGLQSYFGQQLLGARGLTPKPADLLHLATRSGAAALGLAEQVGDLSVGRQFDAVWLRPHPDSTLETSLHYAQDAEDALAKVFALGSPADVDTVWVGGQQLSS